MDNLLLVFPHKVENTKEWDNIINKFDKENYYVYFLEDISTINFDMGSLPNIIDYYKNLHKNINKIVIMSNARDLIFSWYRCYNSIVDDFIYFMDEDENNFFIPKDEYFSFYYNLYEFNGIDKEKIQGKIYLNKKNDIMLPIYYEKKYFDFFSNFDFLNKNRKIPLNKKYIFNDYEYNFNCNEEEQWENVEMGNFNKRIVLIKGQSQYDVLRIGTDYRAKFYKELGFDVDILDLLDPNLIKNINDIIVNKKCDYIYSANCIGIDMELKDGRNLYNLLDIPFLGALGDHPVSHLSRIEDSPHRTLFICIDEENVEYFKKYFPDKKIISHSCIAYPSINYKKKKFSERKIDVLFAGSLIDPIEIKKSWEKLDENIRLIIEYLSNLAIKQKFLINIDNEISKIFLKYNIKNNSLNHREFIHSQVESYVRFYKRYELVKKIGQSDLNVVCIGNVKEYNKLNKSGKLIIKDKVNYQSLLELINDSKMVLNITGHLYNGVTERVLSAMINGAAVVTEKDRFTVNNFKDGENIILYNFETVIDKIKYYQKNIGELEKIALNGQKEAINKYDYRIGICKFTRYIKLL
ncbi:glycosyltransferase [Clostridium sporogenes]|uniref:glycosyltransferase family protein n=1 Tax=Clostridium sporogenes TaxID=1509 RepID=UPI001C1252BF|nr:glycosyltransferase [Clostridium sporogenes]MBU5299937.1 glycosyltransferase [Clostridium sporogenes]